MSALETPLQVMEYVGTGRLSDADAASSELALQVTTTAPRPYTSSSKVAAR